MADTLSDDQREILLAFKEELTKEGILAIDDEFHCRDEDLIRFLKARKFDPKESRDMYMKATHWRKTVGGVGIDEIYAKSDPFWFPEHEVLYTYWPMYWHKVDKLGRPVHVEKMGNVDLKSLYSKLSPERHREILPMMTESNLRIIYPACAQAAGKPIHSHIIILDVKGFGMTQFWQMKDVVQEFSKLAQDYYPETLAKAIIVNAPYTFAYIWSIIKPWVAKDTADKIDIQGTNYRDVLLELIDAENLPEEYGGMCKCEEFGGCQAGIEGPWMKGRTRPIKKEATEVSDQV